MCCFEDDFNEESACYWANLTPETTGLNGYIIWIKPNTKNIRQNLLYLYAQKDNDFIPISIEDEPKILIKTERIYNFNDIKKFIRDNKNILETYSKSNGSISIINILKKIKPLI